MESFWLDLGQKTRQQKQAWQINQFHSCAKLVIIQVMISQPFIEHRTYCPIPREIKSRIMKVNLGPHWSISEYIKYER